MPQREVKYTKGFVIDQVTGYKESVDTRSKVTALLKSMFIQRFKDLGDVEEACKASGFNRRLLAPHLRADSKFRQDFKRTREIIKEQPDLDVKQAVINRLWVK